jgi:hypothetical protein
LSNQITREPRQPLEEAHEGGLVPSHLDIRNESGDENEVDRPGAEHLVGDVDFAALRVLRVGALHGPSFSRERRPV